MMKCELHAHVKGTSWCALSSPEKVIQDYFDAGYGGVVITNHYYAQCYNDLLLGKTHKEKIQSFLSVFDQTKKIGSSKNVKVFLGVEVRDNSGTEYSLMGFNRDFLLNNPPLFELSQKELFTLCEQNGVFMYQTHPFRKGVTPGDPKYMHGAEYFNGHFHHENFNVLAERFCEENNLVKLSGTDYHCPNQPITAGIIIPDSINDEKELIEYIKSEKCELIQEEYKYQINRKDYVEEKK